MTTAIFANPVQTYQFLLVTYYINALSNILYIEDKIKIEEKYQSVPILNAVFEDFHQSENETETKLNLVHRLLRGSDLYGGGENETLDIEYVNATFDYIISNVVFSQFGGVYGYLAVMANSAKNLSLSSFKQEILANLTDLKFITENSSISKLSPLAVNKVFETLILPQFPETKKDMKVTDISFIYAQAGLKLARSTRMDLTNLTFDDLIFFSQTIEMSFLTNNIHVSALEIFTLPGLMFYASERKETFNKEIIAFLLEDKIFINEVFSVLFSFLRERCRIAEEEVNQNNTMYHFVLAMSNFKNRTVIAEENLRKICDFQKESEYERNIPVYKFFAPPYVCPNNGKTLPNLNEDYGKQCDKIKEKYYLHMKFLLKEIFPRDLITLINSPSIIVYEAQVVSSPTCTPCMPKYHNLGSSKYLFATKSEYITRYFSLVQFNNSMKVLRRDIYEDEFREELGLSKEFSNLTFEISSDSKILKYSSDENKTENFDVFVNRAAQNIAEKFRKELYDFGYDKTLGEKIVDIALHFIPFYDCVQDARMGNIGEGLFSCTLDVISLFPIVGQTAKVGLKMGKVMVGTFFKIFARRQALRLTLSGIIQLTGMEIGLYLRKELLSTKILKEFTIGLVRTVDPGFELAGTLAKRGGKYLGNLFRKTLTSVAKKFPFLSVDLIKYKKLWSHMNEMKIGRKFFISHWKDRQVFSKIFPGGVHPYGPKCIRLPSGKAELRRMIGFKREKPFVVSRVTRFGKVYYKRIYLKTGRLSVNEFKLNENGLLTPVRQPFRQHIKTIVTEGLSGKGNIMIKRDESIIHAAEIIEISDLGIDKNTAVITMRKFFLAVDTDENLFSNAIMPTYKQFADDWIRFKKIHDSYSKWFLPNKINFMDLLGIPKVDTIRIKDISGVMGRITKLYGQYHAGIEGIDVLSLMKDYNLLKVNTLIKFEDYYALKNWILNLYGKGEMNMVELVRAQNALYKFGIRLLDRDVQKSPAVVFAGELFHRRVFDSQFSNSEGKVMNFNKFTVTQPNDYSELLLLNVPGNNPDSEIIPVLFEVHLDDVHNTATLAYLFPKLSHIHIIFPETQFQIVKIVNSQYSDIHFKIVELHIVPTQKELRIFKYIQELEIFKAIGAQLYVD